MIAEFLLARAPEEGAGKWLIEIMQMKDDDALTKKVAAMDKAALEMTTAQAASRFEATGGNLTRLFALERSLDRNQVFSDTIDTKRAMGKIGLDYMWNNDILTYASISQGFKSGGNDGINISVPEGTAVKAAEGGVVKYAGSEPKGYGKLVLIQHPNGFVSAYAHNGELDVKRGDTVKRGQTIAKAGQTGNVSSPQVHFELRKGSTPVDPTGYLAGL